jgi:two-component system sensor histidine kinase TctE
MVAGDATLLQELVVNLVDNALRYTPAGGIVTLSIDRDGAAWRLCVQDSGPGIPAEERPRVFERFYRVLGSGTEGSGLGLAIAREIAEGAGGSIALGDAPAPSGGLLVSVRLPMASENDASQTKHAAGRD